MPVHVTCLACGATVRKSPSRVLKRSFCSEPCRVQGRAPLPPIMQDDGSALIPLLARDDVTVVAHAVVDADDAAWAGQWVWRLHPHGYATRQGSDMHRELLGLSARDGMEGDHINRNRLDNRRANLRALPKGKNPQNMSSRAGASSPYRGVDWCKVMKKWRAQIRINGKATYLGCFATEEEAAKVALAARRLHMPYAVD